MCLRDWMLHVTCVSLKSLQEVLSQHISSKGKSWQSLIWLSTAGQILLPKSFPSQDSVQSLLSLSQWERKGKLPSPLYSQVFCPVFQVKCMWLTVLQHPWGHSLHAAPNSSTLDFDFSASLLFPNLLFTVSSGLLLTAHQKHSLMKLWVAVSLQWAFYKPLREGLPMS